VTAASRALTGWETVDDDQCRRATSTMELVGRRWTGGIMLALGRGASRFSEVLGTVEGLSDRMLSVRLKELEHAGLVDRMVEPTTPVTVRYGLSPRGRDLLAALQPLQQYGQRWEPQP
jgi:DNA-binding HxlR family transcriptional regulator